MVAFDAGSRVESYGDKKYNDGIAHMLEHCIFKGTNKRGWQDINREIGFIGGDVNAFTSHDMVAYYITVPYENTEVAVEILSDIVLNSIVPEEEFKKEVEVVKEEEFSKHDDIGSFIWNSYSPIFFDNYIANPVIGTQETISRFSRDEVYSFYRSFCKRDNAVVSISGSQPKREMKKLLVKYFGAASKNNVLNYNGEFSSYSDSKTISISKEGIEHSYVWVGFPGVAARSDLSAPAKILNIVLGSGMDSRLFTEVREKRGLAYSVGSSLSQWQYGSLNLINASTRPSNVDDMLQVINDEVDRIKSGDLTEEEVQRAKNKMRSGFYHAGESSYSASHRSIRTVLFEDSTFSELEAKMNNVSVKDVLDAANQTFDLSKAITMICNGE
tara:strand:+ start:56 stop:1210 length:1155 start_codon:yes stop_codon:yes gene_type:complete